MNRIESNRNYFFGESEYSSTGLYLLLQFSIDGMYTNCWSIDEYPHLRHITSSNLDEKSDILSKRNSLCGKINNALRLLVLCLDH